MTERSSSHSWWSRFEARLAYLLPAWFVVVMGWCERLPRGQFKGHFAPLDSFSSSHALVKDLALHPGPGVQVTQPRATASKAPLDIHAECQRMNDAIEHMVGQIVETLQNIGRNEVSSAVIGNMVLDHLAHLDAASRRSSGPGGTIPPGMGDGLYGRHTHTGCAT